MAQRLRAQLEQLSELQPVLDDESDGADTVVPEDFPMPGQPQQGFNPEQQLKVLLSAIALFSLKTDVLLAIATTINF